MMPCYSEAQRRGRRRNRQAALWSAEKQPTPPGRIIGRRTATSGLGQALIGNPRLLLADERPAMSILTLRSHQRTLFEKYTKTQPVLDYRYP
jgi:hypothetical protein